MCQDTGTAIVLGKKGRRVWTGGPGGDGDEAALAGGVYDAYHKANLRYSQVTPLSMYDESNTKSNLPAQIEIYSEGEDAYKFLFIAKGGGSANKSFLFQAMPSVLGPERLYAFLDEKIRTIGTAACPPYHLAVVIGGLSAEQTMKTVKLASCHYLDSLPTAGSEAAQAYRDLELEATIQQMTQEMGIGAPVRRQVLRPRRPGHPPAAPRRVFADRHRRLLLGRSPGPGQDHPRRRLPRAPGRPTRPSTCPR